MNNMRKKAQTAPEIIVLIGVGLLMLILFMSLSYQRVDVIRTEKKYQELEDLTYMVQKEIIIASESKDGYLRNFSMPVKLNNKEYNVTTNNNMVYIESEGTGHFLRIPPISGKLVKGTNTIIKRHGLIFINIDIMTGESDPTICANAHNNPPLCDWLDWLFGDGYKDDCWNNYGYCP